MPPKSRKRDVEVIDLTDENTDWRAPAKAQRLSSEHRSASSVALQTHNVNGAVRSPSFGNNNNVNRGARSYRSGVYESGDEEQAEGLSQDYNERSYVEKILYGTTDTAIVGCRFYNGYANPGEMVILQRQPNNKFDSNAIQVQNVNREQIGHINKKLAAKLAKYMDNESLLIEGFIAGAKTYYDCPLMLKYYGTSEPVERINLTNEMKADKLSLDGIKKREKELREQMMREKAAKKGKGSQIPETGPESEYSSSMRSFGADLDPNQVEVTSERFDPRNSENFVEQYGMTEEQLMQMPKAEQPEGMSAKLLPYQLQGLKWMLDKESPKLPSGNSGEAVQLWTVRKGATPQQTQYTNLATNYALRGKDPELASGGILADDMGLGKTIQVISLIMADRELGIPRTKDTSDATLILSPLSVMSNWSGQIKRHVKPDSELRVLVYHGQSKKRLDSAKIKDHDVVVTTYESVSSEYWAAKDKKTGLFSIKWRRVVLDEGHNIRNPGAKRAIAATSLDAQSRWILTGTPIVNSLKDLFSLSKFLRLTGGLDQFTLFHSAIIRPVNYGEVQGNFVLQSLMKDICLRRKKDMKFVDLKIPELTEYVHKIEFSPHEREKYDALEAQAKGSLDEFQSSRKRHAGTAAAEAYRHLLEILLRMRQVCNHWSLCGVERLTSILPGLEAGAALTLNKENCEALQKLLQISIDSQEDCPVCLDSLVQPVITACAHIFCFPCIERVVDGQQKCPMCRTEIENTTKLVRPAEETQESDREAADPDRPSSKVKALLSILCKTRRRNDGTKTVVFSQWTSFLDVAGTYLDGEGIGYVRIDGTMKPAERDAAMDALERDPDKAVLLASLGACSVGLNLVAASQVVLCDTWWAPAVEDQAVDRVHRLGQTRPTAVFRLVMRGSIEERVVQIQQDKRRLMGLAFAEKMGGKKERGSRLEDINRLLG